MSETKTLPALHLHVDSMVDPIPASPGRKRAMREELLSHVIGAFDQELAGNNSPETALAAAKHRFGNVDAVREELLRSIPPLERLLFQFLTPREPLMNLILRWILVGISCMAIGIGIILPGVQRLRAGETFTAAVGIAFTIGIAIAVIGVASSVYRVFKLSRN